MLTIQAGTLLAPSGAVYVHTLRFTDANELSRAFGHLKSSAFVEGCLVEPEILRIRFAAPSEPAARLVEHLYLHGGITWCHRHRLGARLPSYADSSLR